MQMIWSAAQGDVSPPRSLPLLLHLSISLVLPLSLRRNAFCFACCLCPESHLFLLLFARLLFFSLLHRLGWGEGTLGVGGAEPTAAPFS